MRDCKVTLEVKNDKLVIHGKHVSIEELAILCGYFQCYVGVKALKNGMPVDEIREALLDMSLEAGQTVEMSANQGVNK